MKILHTSDWHIGKKTENYDRLPEQAEVLDEICDIADRENVELVLVAGDDFDTFVPSSEAEELFYEKIVKLASGRAVIVISGNHDDATRLCASAPLAVKQGVYFAGNVNTDDNASAKKSGGGVELTGSGEGYVTVSNVSGEEIYVGMLPYPSEARFREKNSGETHAQKIAGWMKKCFAGNVKNLPAVFVSHLFTVGGLTSDGEREISLGGAKAVDKASFPETLYTALGHLHKRQVIDKEKNVIYSGSVLQYAFDEVNVEKSVTVFEIKKGAVTDLHVVPLTRGKRLARLSATSVQQAAQLLKNYENYLVELTLKLKSPINREENAYLHTEFPNVISLKLELPVGVERGVKGRKEMNDETLFNEYYKKQYGDEPEKELTRLFLSLLTEVNEK
ncbi:MAG: exonuclease subunit SbcD [Clostridia bacterium]|nr:exonuclease subunit SbcD [Clostridia bacterium]